MNTTLTATNYADFANCTKSEQQRFLNAFNFHLTAYGIANAESIVSVKYNPRNKLWQVQYLTPNNEIIKWETLYDSELTNAFTQVERTQEFDAYQEVQEVVSALREEFSNVQLTTGNDKYIIRFRALVITLLIRNNEIIWCNRFWDTGRQWVEEYVDKTYRTYTQVQSFKAQLRSDFWFEMEVLEVA